MKVISKCLFKIPKNSFAVKSNPPQDLNKKSNPPQDLNKKSNPPHELNSNTKFKNTNNRIFDINQSRSQKGFKKVKRYNDFDQDEKGPFVDYLKLEPTKGKRNKSNISDDVLEEEDMTEYLEDYYNSFDQNQIDEDLKYRKKALEIINERKSIKPKVFAEDDEIKSIKKKLENISNKKSLDPNWKEDSEQITSTIINESSNDIYTTRYSKGYHELRNVNFVKDFPLYYEKSYKLLLKKALGKSYEKVFIEKSNHLLKYLENQKSKILEKKLITNFRNPQRENKNENPFEKTFKQKDEFNLFLSVLYYINSIGINK